MGAGVLAGHALGLDLVRITTSSMAPTVKPGEWILVRDGTRARRGDVVRFSFPLGTSGRAIKRVIAVAGDTVAIAPHLVTVNGRPITVAGAPSAAAAQARTETVGPGHVFLLGDNAPDSIDSRSFGTVPTRYVDACELLVLGGPLALAGIAVALAALATAAAALGRRSERR